MNSVPFIHSILILRNFTSPKSKLEVKSRGGVVFRN